MTKKPHADTPLAQYIERRVLELKPKKSQGEIASEVGFPNPNMVTMIKNGTSKLALDRVNMQTEPEPRCSSQLMIATTPSLE
ncbi:hypothetical protein [Pseudophaeobacter sp.]|uniref:hypothetical protein n=1 Tax=Pseudophaeobacter sp. TaxID=1971739 RepID=UPI0034568EE0